MTSGYQSLSLEGKRKKRDEVLAICRHFKDENGEGSLSDTAFKELIERCSQGSVDIQLQPVLEAAGRRHDGRVELEEFMLWLFDDVAASPNVACNAEGKALIDVTGPWATGDDEGGFFLSLKQDPFTGEVTGSGKPVGAPEVRALGKAVGEELVYSIDNSLVKTTYTMKLLEDGLCLEGHWTDTQGKSGVHKMRRGPPLAEKGDAAHLGGIWCVPSSSDMSFIKIEQEAGGKVQVALDPSSIMSGLIEGNKLTIDAGGASLELSISLDGTFLEDHEDRQRWCRVAC